jgi:hypothetical protein
MTITTFHVQDNPKILKRYKEYFEPGGAVEMKAFGITPAVSPRWSLTSHANF